MLPGHILQHYKGGRYLVLMQGTLEGTVAPAVVYASLADGRIWIRPLAEMEELVPWFDGKTRRRYIIVEPAAQAPLPPPPRKRQ